MENYHCRLLFSNSYTGKPDALNILIEPTEKGSRVKVTWDDPTCKPLVDCVAETVQTLQASEPGEQNLFSYVPAYWNLKDGDYMEIIKIKIDNEMLHVFLTRDADEGANLEVAIDEDEVDSFYICDTSLLNAAKAETAKFLGDAADFDRPNSVTLYHEQFKKEEVFSKRDLYKYWFNVDDVDVWTTMNIPAMKVKKSILGSEDYKAEAKWVFETPEDLIAFLKDLRHSTIGTIERDKAICAFGATNSVVLLKADGSYYTDHVVAGEAFGYRPHRFNSEIEALSWAGKYEKPYSRCLPVISQCAACGGPVVGEYDGTTLIKTFCVVCPQADTGISDDETYALVCRGWIEGLVRLVGPEDETDDDYPDWASGIVCKIGSCAFWFGGQEAEEYNNSDEYLKDHSVDDIVAQICEVLSSFRHGAEDEREEFAYYVAWLKEHLATDADKKCESASAYIDRHFDLDAAHKRTIDGVLRWAFENLPADKREELFEEAFDFGMTDAELLGISADREVYHG